MDTPSKLRQPRRTSVKVDIEAALQEANVDPMLIENLHLDTSRNASSVNTSQPNTVQLADNPFLAAGASSNMQMKRRRPSSPPRLAGKFGNTTMTSVPRRGLSSIGGGQALGVGSYSQTSAVKASIMKAKAAASASVRKQSFVAIDMNATMAAADDAENKARIKELEQLTTQLQQQLADYSQSQVHLQAQLEDSEHKIVGLETFKRTLESRVSNKEAESSELGQELKKLRDQASHERQEATTYANRLKQELGDQIAQLEETRAALQKDLKANQEALKASSEENEALKSTINRQSVTALDLDSQIAALKAKLQAAQNEIISRSVTCDDLAKRLTDAQDAISGLKGKLQEAETVRRRLHNTVQELKGNIRVFCRVRPLLASECRNGADEELKHLQIVKKLDEPEEISLQQEVESATGQTTVKSSVFQFDRVFGPHASQQDVFEEISQLVQSALDGYRVCIFAYGQTGSGKTFTMEGAPAEERLLGMIPRAVQQVFATSAELNRDKHWQFGFEASYLEIYNETIRDLLGSGDDTAKHDIKHLPNVSKTIVTDLTTVPVESPEAVLALLKRAGHNRAVAETLCNDRSSRSHSVFVLKISGTNAVTGESVEGLLNLIDLAGSERLSQSGSTGDRLKETQAINKSLSSLGDVIAALANREQHIPYRNSKLTYLLQHSLGGNSKTLMFVNVNPSLPSFNETICSLRFATKVNACQIGTARRQNVTK